MTKGSGLRALCGGNLSKCFWDVGAAQRTIHMLVLAGILSKVKIPPTIPESQNSYGPTPIE